MTKAKAHPDAFNFATGGYGSAGHMAAESFKLRAGLNVPVVLYKGTGPAFTDLLGGTISGMLDPLVTSLPLAQGKQATALAIASPKRSPLAPDVPTFAEAGYPGFRVLHLVWIVGAGESTAGRRRDDLAQRWAPSVRRPTRRNGSRARGSNIREWAARRLSTFPGASRISMPTS